MSKNHSIQINSIYCGDTSEHSCDEVYLVCQSDAGIPIRVPAGINPSQPMKKGQTWTLDDLILNFEYEVLVTLWDHDGKDNPNWATYLQSHDFGPGSGSGSIQLTNPNDANYTINYTYLD